MRQLTIRQAGIAKEYELYVISLLDLQGFHVELPAMTGGLLLYLFSVAGRWVAATQEAATWCG